MIRHKTYRKDLVPRTTEIIERVTYNIDDLLDDYQFDYDHANQITAPGHFPIYLESDISITELKMMAKEVPQFRLPQPVL